MTERNISEEFIGEVCFRQLIEKTADGVLVIGVDGRIAYANPAARELLDREAAELVGMPFGIPLAPGEIAEIDLCSRETGQNSAVVEMRVVEVEWQSQRALLATLRDITQRKHAAKTLTILSEASKQLAHSLNRQATVECLAKLSAEYLADWCVIDLLDPESNRSGVPKLDRLVFAPRSNKENSIARSLTGLYEVPSEDTCGISRVLRKGGSENYSNLTESEIRALALDERRMPAFLELGISSALVVPMIAGGQVIGVITLVTTTQERQFEDEEQVLAEQLAERAALALENARLYDESQEALKRRDEFLAMLAHELRNPLSPIVTAAELMKQQIDNVDLLKKCIVTIERQSRHLSRLLDDLLDLSRITQGKIDLQFEPVEVEQVIQDALQIAHGIIEQRRHQLQVDIQNESLIVEGDATRLAQILGNLLTNAARYSGVEGTIKVRAFREGAEVVLQVQDSGRGIPAEYLNRIFEPFLQVNPAIDRAESGLGIGLTLVRRLTELHHGRVIAYSDGLGQGSLFDVRIPASTSLPRKFESQPIRTKPRRIVLIEDNTDGQELLSELLRT